MQWPQLAIGVVVAAYWGRVLRLAVKVRRRTGRAGNLVPGERVGRWTRLPWAAAVLVWITLPIAVGVGGHLPRVVRPIGLPSPALAWAAAVVVAAAAAMTTFCWRRMGKSWRMGITPGERTTLVLGGPYARVRHPIYSLSILMMLGTVAAVPSPLMFAAAALHVSLLLWEAMREERHLLHLHGELYANYAATIGRFVPRLARRHV